jgi:cobalamin biosynthesis Mg chelatase CobN
MTITAMEVIDDSIRNNRIYRLQSELNALEEGELNSGIEARIQQIRTILADIEKDRQEKNLDGEKLKDHKRQMKEAVYKARWHTLNADQRLNRLNEYLTRALVVDQNIISRLREMVRANELKSKDVEYRIDMGKIISIKILTAEDGKFVLEDPSAKSKSKSKSKSGSTSKSGSSRSKTKRVAKSKATKSVTKKKTTSNDSSSANSKAKASKARPLKAKASKAKAAKPKAKAKGKAKGKATGRARKAQ